MVDKRKLYNRKNQFAAQQHKRLINLIKFNKPSIVNRVAYLLAIFRLFCCFSSYLYVCMCFFATTSLVNKDLYISSKHRWKAISETYVGIRYIRLIFNGCSKADESLDYHRDTSKKQKKTICAQIFFSCYATILWWIKMNTYNIWKKVCEGKPAGILYLWFM